MELNDIGDNRYLYVCEGKTDSDRLKKLGCLFVVETGGKYIPREVIEFLKEVHKIREIVLVLDPDSPGKEIKEKLKRELGKCLTCYVKQKDAKDSNNKIGIAQAKSEVLKEALAPFIKHDLFIDENLSLGDDDYYELGLSGESSREKREKVVKHFRIPFQANKKIEDALLMLSITRSEIEDIIDEWSRKSKSVISKI